MKSEKEDICFKKFKSNIDELNIPQNFTFPFNYIPHPLCKIATQELQDEIETYDFGNHNFGISEQVNGSNIGKMFGVLLVRNQQNQLGYLAGFSGKIDNRNFYPGFVPPLFDILDETGFYRIEELEITEINKEISRLQKSDNYLKVKSTLEQAEDYANNDLAADKENLKAAKRARNELRASAEKILTPEEFIELKEELKNESLKIRYDYKQKAKFYKEKLSGIQQQFKDLNQQIAERKRERKERSAILQEKLFNQYQFLNTAKEIQSVFDIFEHTPQKTPPSGAGECAAPRLLQYAFQNNYTPLAMAEFWWGQSPKSEIKKHKNFYPSCRSKCEPILGHMLAGMQIDENPAALEAKEDKEVDIIFEDDHIAIVNKPHEFLSVPGKTETNSVETKMQNKYPNATGPIIVHRLDMSTSGILIIAKTKDAHKHLQNQFLEKTIEKRYVAILAGKIQDKKGQIELPLRVDLDNRPRQLVCDEHGKFAKTKWTFIKYVGNYTKVYFYPITGRTHQLRVHAAHSRGLNIPILGDDLYGEKSSRLFLHAERIRFIHPHSLENIEFSCPDSFEKTLAN